MPHIVLVHGAWHGAWCWHKTMPLLQAAGFTPHAIDLPGHGLRAAEPQTLFGYAEAVVDTLKTLDEPAVLLGHSMGGQIISLAAEIAPQRISSLVYLCAFLTQPDEPVLVRAFDDHESGLAHVMTRDADGHFIIDEKGLKPVFYADCSDEDVALAKLCLVPQSGEPLGEVAPRTDERFGSVRRAYIVCTEDKAIGPTRQREMMNDMGVAASAELRTGHSPFFSAPQALVNTIRDVLD